MGFNWNPVSWWNDLYGAATSVGSAVANFVNNAVISAVNLVENDIGDAIDTAYNWFQDAESYSWGLAETAIGDANSWGEYAVGQAEGLFSRAESDIGQGVNDAISTAENLYNQAVNDADYLFNRAEADATQWVGDAINDAEGFAHTVEVDAENALNTLAGWVKDDVLDPLLQGLTDLGDLVAGPLKYLEGEVAHAVGLVEGAAGWLEWIALLPFDGVEAFIGVLEGKMTLANVQANSPAWADAASEVDRALAYVIGG